jgi:hypothetical protein
MDAVAGNPSFAFGTCLPDVEIRFQYGSHIFVFALSLYWIPISDHLL